MLIVLNVIGVEIGNPKYAGLSPVELAALADIWDRQSNDSNVMFLCSVCKPKVTLALKFFTDIRDKQDTMNKGLTEIEASVKKL